MPFAAAVAVLRGRFGWDDYDLLGTADADAIAARVEVRQDPTLERGAHPFGATLEVTARGETHALRIPDPSGEPETFPDDAALAQKFRDLAGPVRNATSDAWLERLQSLGRAQSVADHLR